MQDYSEKVLLIKNKIGKIFRELRKKEGCISLNKLALEYDIDKGSLSKVERGIYDCRISTALKICEANGIKFSDFAKLLENELGEKFKFIDD